MAKPVKGTYSTGLKVGTLVKQEDWWWELNKHFWESEQSTTTSPSTTQVGGSHYKHFKIQPYKFCYENNLNNLQSEVISYVARYPFKWKDNVTKQIEDLEKAKHSIELLIELIKNESN